MGQLKVQTTKLQDVKIITPKVFGDNRGFFEETYSDRDFKEAGSTLTLFRTTNHCLVGPVFCGVCTSNVVRLPRQS